MITAVLEYQWKAYSPPNDNHAWDIKAKITHQFGGIATTITRGLLADLRQALDEAGLTQQSILPICKRPHGRWDPLWREVWKGEGERFPGKTEKEGKRMDEKRLLKYARHALQKYPQLNSRPKNAVELVRRGHVVRTGVDTFRVKSQNGNTTYLVDLEARSCTCYDWQHNAPPVCNGPMCKHRMAALLWLKMQETPKETASITPQRKAQLLELQQAACESGHPVMLIA